MRVRYSVVCVCVCVCVCARARVTRRLSGCMCVRIGEMAVCERVGCCEGQRSTREKVTGVLINEMSVSDTHHCKKPARWPP